MEIYVPAKRKPIPTQCTPHALIENNTIVQITHFKCHILGLVGQQGATEQLHLRNEIQRIIEQEVQEDSTSASTAMAVDTGRELWVSAYLIIARVSDRKWLDPPDDG